MIIKEFFDTDSQTFSYVVADDTSGICAIIDSVLGFDMPSARTDTTLADDIIAYINAQAWTVAWHLETHIHADHLSAASYLKSKLGGKIAISHRIDEVQSIFSEIYHLDFKSANAMMGFDYFFQDDENFAIGALSATAIATPGHTPACMSYLIDNAVFVGDTLFMPDYGTARCDFPKGSSRTLYHSVQKLYELPDDTAVHLCHDYLPPSRQAFVHKTTIGDQKQHNIHLNSHTTEQTFVALRDAKDRTLPVPKLLLPSIQVNLMAGNLPSPEDNGTSYLKIPLNRFL